MKLLLGVLLSITLLVGYTVQKDRNTILWSKDYLLEWKDFKDFPKQNIGYDAMTDYVIESQKENGKLGIFCYFDKSKSWRIKKKESALLLRHEQYHFHLAEVYTRKIRKQIIELNLIKDQKELQRIFKENFKQLEKEQKLYDKETDHSKNLEMQSKWEKNIDHQLQALNKFASPLVE